MNSSTLVFDLETKHLAHEVGGWSSIDKLGLAAAVLLAVETNETYRFLEQDAEELIRQLLKADQIVGFNIVRFDYQVLRPYGLTPGSDLIHRTVDLLNHIYQRLGFRISLDNLAEATLGEHKIADGLAAVKWYREGKSTMSSIIANKMCVSPIDFGNTDGRRVRLNTGIANMACVLYRSPGSRKAVEFVDQQTLPIRNPDH